MRVVRFHVNWRPLSPPPPPPDLNCKLLIAVFPAGPEQQAQDQSIPECSPPDLNCKLMIAVFPGPQLQACDRSIPRRTRTASSGSECSAGPRPQRISEEISDKMPERRSEDMSDRMP